MQYRLFLFIYLTQWIHNHAFLVAKQSSRLSFQATIQTSTTRHSLFFRAREQQRQSNAYATPERLKKLSSSSLKLPFVINNDDAVTITVRKMEAQDLKEIVELCMEEYGKKTKSNLIDQLDEWWLQLLVDSTMRMKLVLDKPLLEKDHTILVATQQTPQQLTPRVVGMIEVSWQPVLPDRIPPAVPIPLSWKRLYCQVTRTPLQAWIGNLLIAPATRRRGLAQLLVAATEGVVAQRANCTSLHLHCDAQYAGAQRLYQSMGYRIVPKEENSFSFDEGVAWQNSIYMVDGVALLYMQKEILSL